MKSLSRLQKKHEPIDFLPAPCWILKQLGGGVPLWSVSFRRVDFFSRFSINASTTVNPEAARVYIRQRIESWLHYRSRCAAIASSPLPRWTYSDAEYCCQLYKNFLLLIKKHLPTLLVPTREIDEFWHNHILYTRNYLQDCKHIFGHYLHHEPASPDEEPEKLIEGFLRKD